MFLACQMRKMEEDYKQHKDNLFYKNIVVRVSKRLNRSLRKHKNDTMVFISTPRDRQYQILNMICEEYRNAGYVAEIRNVSHSSDVYIYISW